MQGEEQDFHSLDDKAFTSATEALCLLMVPWKKTTRDAAHDQIMAADKEGKEKERAPQQSAANGADVFHF
jgi:hypothetical protein